jgi:hypothetical protein
VCKHTHRVEDRLTTLLGVHCTARMHCTARIGALKVSTKVEGTHNRGAGGSILQLLLSLQLFAEQQHGQHAGSSPCPCSPGRCNNN